MRVSDEDVEKSIKKANGIFTLFNNEPDLVSCADIKLAHATLDMALDLRDLRALCRELVEKDHTVGCGCLWDQVEAIKLHLEAK